LSKQSPLNPAQALVISQTPGSSVPFDKVEQVPCFPVKLQALHLSVQGVSQQTLSTQYIPIAQSASDVQAMLQGAQSGPPQSTPVSSPFFSPSLHETHVLSLQ
jgi:hypothetical protein